MQRRYRLRRNADFVHLRQHGKVYRHPGLLLSLLPNDLSHNRYGFITSKQLGKAVVRNRLRRLLREAIRQLHPRLRPGLDLALVARPDLVGQPLVAVQRILEELCNRAGIVVEEQTHENTGTRSDSLL